MFSSLWSTFELMMYIFWVYDLHTPGNCRNKGLGQKRTSYDLTPQTDSSRISRIWGVGELGNWSLWCIHPWKLQKERFMGKLFELMIYIFSKMCRSQASILGGELRVRAYDLHFCLGCRSQSDIILCFCLSSVFFVFWLGLFSVVFSYFLFWYFGLVWVLEGLGWCRAWRAP